MFPATLASLFDKMFTMLHLLTAKCQGKNQIIDFKRALGYNRRVIRIILREIQ